jgi:hypothetical protein
VLTTAALALAATSSWAGTLTLQHEPVACVQAGAFPRLEAHIEPPENVARARVYFHRHGTQPWYFVEMRGRVRGSRECCPSPRRTPSGSTTT